ncbi:hypothetical protein HMPREF1152_0666 [Mogibacterium sp. CM50]|nr:hypothetical protein HMPREF1152_0666 [Mogibacterium sp. CM50]
MIPPINSCGRLVTSNLAVLVLLSVLALSIHFRTAVDRIASVLRFRIAPIPCNSNEVPHDVFYKHQLEIHGQCLSVGLIRQKPHVVRHKVCHNTCKTCPICFSTHLFSFSS